MGNEQCFKYLPCQSTMDEDVDTPTTLPQRPSYRPQAVINNKQPCQVPFNDMKKPLHYNIGIIISLHPIKKLQFQGTGFLISENLVLTCGHNICNILHGRKKHESIKFYPSVHGKLTKFYKVQESFIPNQYFACSGKQLTIYDYAILKLQQPVPSTQFLPLAEQFQEFHSPSPLSIYGYPCSDRFKDYKNQDGITQTYMIQAGLTESQKIILENPMNVNRILYQISTLGGQSGSPVIITKDNSQFIIGIHQGGFEADIKNQITLTNTRVICNIGRLLTHDLIQNLTAWKNKSKGMDFDYFNYKHFITSYIKRNSVIHSVAQFSTRRQSIKLSPRDPKIMDYQTKPRSKYLDLTTPFIRHFSVQNSDITRLFSPIINKKYKDNISYYQVVSQKPLLPVSITSFKLMAYGGPNAIIFGVIAHQRKFDAWNKGLNIFSIGFISLPSVRKGTIYNQGVQVQYWKKQLFIEQGSILTIEVNQPLLTVQFSNKENKFKLSLGSHFKDINLYTYISMRNKNSYVKILSSK